MAFVPNRFRSSAPATAILPAIDRLFSSDGDAPVEPVQGSPFAAGGAAHIAYCQVWAPPFDLDELDLYND